jgi:nucleotidyltransferase AbiEii toxin of type IV toxin-antitoxin system
MRKPITNVPASVRARLLQRSKEVGEDFSLLLRYAAERFLYRLGQSPYRSRFVLKGAMLFAIWGGSMYRSTRDLDLMGFGPGEEAALAQASARSAKRGVRTTGSSSSEARCRSSRFAMQASTSAFARD